MYVQWFLKEPRSDLEVRAILSAANSSGIQEALMKYDGQH